ncbi:MAG: GTPase ObgE [Firmicutes bacterium ADurb.Bin300]|jgi:GTP-binding protein|nr:MAG: GTPase ObgE [Firmicutes bacterium ADurb.Bin300]
MFVDFAKITVKAGNGGNGAVSFHREKYVAAGGPDGGDGGKGGSIIFKVDDNLTTLSDFRYKRKYTAQSGQNGSGARKSGKSAKDVIIKIPRGTIIKESETGTILADMSVTETFIAAKGGSGGWGNSHFATPTRQAPRFAKDGMPGEEWTLILELKLIADVGLIGFPNVGKSTLISVVSEAKPIIADYHFTTLIPVPGVVRMGPESSFVIADIPGIIEGASEGAGLGHEFLRHIERCRLLVHILDAAGSEERDPIEDFETINSELKDFNNELASYPQIVVGNKTDLATREQLNRLREYMSVRGFEYYEIIAPIAEGTEKLMQAVSKKLATLPPVRIYEASEIPLESMLINQGEFDIKVEDGVYMIQAPWLAKILSKTDPEDYESLQYFQTVLHKSGIIDSLIEMGISEGDTVSIYDTEFEYVP